MLKDKSKNIENTRKRWDERAKRYDDYYKTFEGAVEHHVDWELLKGHLPKNTGAKILDAAGGTGRITLPLAKMGYSVTLCDISPEMLNMARRKLVKEGLINNVKILECDICQLRFADESFDFVLCWNGMLEVANELTRVTKKGGKISMFLVNRYGTAISEFCKDPDSALALITSKSNYIYGDEQYTVVGVEEARVLCEKEGIKVIDIYAVCGMLELLSIPEEVRKSRTWGKKFFKQVSKMLLRLSKEPSVKGLSRHLVLYGENI